MTRYIVSDIIFLAFTHRKHNIKNKETPDRWRKKICLSNQMVALKNNMTIKEIEQTLPNGFHDSKVSDLHIDYIHRTLKIDISIWIGDMEKTGGEREKYRGASLELSGFQYCVLEAPDNRYEFTNSKSLCVDLCNPKVKPILPTNIPEEAFVESFFVNEWNSFINIAALNANLTWI